MEYAVARPEDGDDGRLDPQSARRAGTADAVHDNGSRVATPPRRVLPGRIERERSRPASRRRRQGGAAALRTAPRCGAVVPVTVVTVVPSGANTAEAPRAGLPGRTCWGRVLFPGRQRAAVAAHKRDRVPRLRRRLSAFERAIRSEGDGRDRCGRSTHDVYEAPLRRPHAGRAVDGAGRDEIAVPAERDGEHLTGVSDQSRPRHSAARIPDLLRSRRVSP